MFDHTALHHAFLAVQKNHGCAGVDGITIDRFEEDLTTNLVTLRDELNDQTYSPLPLLKIQVAKKNGEPRGLSIPTVRDRIAQTVVLHRIGPLFEKEFEECSYGYRKGRSVRQAVFKIKEYYDQGYCWVVDADIDAFFDNVDHVLLLEKVMKIIPDQKMVDLISLWIAAEVWDGTVVSVLHQGLPQGSAISPVLANLFLDELDEEMLRNGYRFIRYADDYVVLGRSPQEAQAGLELSEQVLAKLLLELDEKEVVSFEQGFTYLGVTFMNSLIMTPFAQPKQNRQILFYPPPLDFDAYLKHKGVGANGKEKQDPWTI